MAQAGSDAAGQHPRFSEPGLMLLCGKPLASTDLNWARHPDTASCRRILGGSIARTVWRWYDYGVPTAKKASDMKRTERALEERRHSPNLKVFIYTPHANKLAHLFAVTSTGDRFPLCGRRIDDTVPTRETTTLDGRICALCRREAQEILSRKTSLDRVRISSTRP
jgi:hypothetical protein